MARAQHAENDVTLRDAGATAVVVPELAGASMLLEESLILLGLPHEHIFTGLSTLSSHTGDMERDAVATLAEATTPDARESP